MVAFGLLSVLMAGWWMAIGALAFSTTVVYPWKKEQINLNGDEYKILEFFNERLTEEKGDLVFAFQNSNSEAYKVSIYLSLEDIVYDEVKKEFSNEKLSFKEKELIISKTSPNNVNNQRYYLVFNKKCANYFTIANELDPFMLAPNEFTLIEKLFSKHRLIVEFKNEDHNIFIIRTYSSYTKGTIELYEKGKTDPKDRIFIKEKFGMESPEYINKDTTQLGKTYHIYINSTENQISLRFAIDMMPSLVKELLPEDHVNKFYVSNNEYFFYVDISAYDRNEENTVQILLEQSNDYEKNKLQIFSKQIQCPKESIKDQFDFDSPEFPIGLFVNQYDKKTLAVYFKKTRAEKENIYLLLKVKVKEFAGNTQEIKVILTKRIEMISLKANEPQDIMKQIPVNVGLPVYLKVQFDPEEISKKSNVVFRSLEQTVLNITFGNLITEEDSAENKNTIQNQLYIFQRNENIKKKLNTLTFKFTNLELVNKTYAFEIAFVDEDLIYLPNKRKADTLPIEMINCSRNLYIIGCYDSFRIISTDKYSLYIEEFYGKVNMRYKERLDFSGRFVDILPNETNSKPVLEEHLELNNEIDFFKLECLTPTRVTFHFFKQETPSDETELFAGNSLLFLLKGTLPLRLKLKFYISQQLIQMKSIDKKEVFYNLDDQNGKLEANTYEKSINMTSYVEKMCSLSFSSDLDTFIYLKFANNSDVNIIIDGNTDINRRSNIIKLKYLEKNNYDYARISITPQTTLPSIAMKYDFGITKDNFIYHPRHEITLEKEWVITLSNPYRKPYQKINETNNEYYYFALQFLTEKEFLVYIEYKYVNETIRSNISMTSSTVVQNGNYYRLSYDMTKGKGNEYVVMSINQCANKSKVNITYDTQLLKNIVIEEKRNIYQMSNYQIDMKLKITPIESSNSSIGMNYFFSTHKSYGEYRVNSNYSIFAHDNGKQLNLKWPPYFTNHPNEVNYSIYISSPNRGSLEQYDDFCSISVLPKNETFALSSQSLMVSSDNDDYSANELLNEMNITINKAGKYYVNIIGHGQSGFPIITAYDAIQIEILRPFNYLLWSLVGAGFLALIGGVTFFIVKYIKKKKLKEEIKIDNSIEPFPDEINRGSNSHEEDSSNLTDKLV